MDSFNLNTVYILDYNTTNRTSTGLLDYRLKNEKLVVSFLNEKNDSDVIIFNDNCMNVRFIYNIGNTTDNLASEKTIKKEKSINLLHEMLFNSSWNTRKFLNTLQELIKDSDFNLIIDYDIEEE